MGIDKTMCTFSANIAFDKATNGQILNMKCGKTFISMSLLKIEGEKLPPSQRSSLETLAFISVLESCGCSVLDMPESKEMTEQTDWRAIKTTITGGLRLGRSEVLRILRHVTTCGHKAKDITPSIAWAEEREA